MNSIFNFLNRFFYGLADLIGMTNAQKVYSTARACGLNDVQAKIILCQAIHETGMFTSNVFKDDNNCFGIKYPSVRPKTYIAGKSKRVMLAEGSTPYCHYNSIEDSVRDLILGWHVYNHTDWTKITSPQSYAAYIQSKGYFGASLSSYTAALNAQFVKVKDLA